MLCGLKQFVKNHFGSKFIERGDDDSLRFLFDDFDDGWWHEAWWVELAGRISVGDQVRGGCIEKFCILRLMS